MGLRAMSNAARKHTARYQQQKGFHLKVEDNPYASEAGAQSGLW
jgi:hypothetical protein